VRKRRAMSSRAVEEVQSETRESVDELVNKLHQKILQRTLKEAELALIRKTNVSLKKGHTASLQPHPPPLEEQRRQASTSVREESSSIFFSRK
jgi:hypothetical protein